MLKSVTEDNEKLLDSLEKSRLVFDKSKKSIKMLGECKELRVFIRSKSKGKHDNIYISQL